MAKKNNSIKYWLGQAHLWGGLVSGIVVFIVSITGCLFVFEEEIRNLTQQHYRFVEPQKTTRVKIATIKEVVEKEFPGKQIEQIRVFADASRSTIVKLIDAKAKPQKGDKEKEYKKEAYAFNPYTGALLGRYNLEHDFMHIVEDMHKSLLLGEVGKWIIKVNIVVFFVMLLSGLYLWWPRKKNQRKFAFTINVKSKFQVLNYSFHNVLGFYFLLPLLLITLTGIWWAIKPVQKLTYTALGEKLKEEKKLSSTYQEGKIFSSDMAFAKVSEQYGGWQEAHINVAKNKKEPVKVNLKYPYQIYKKSNVFEFDQYSGEILKAELYNDYKIADKIKHSNRDLHTGQNFGILGKLLAFFSSLFSATLPITGFLIWYQRKYKKAPKKALIPRKAAISIARVNQVLQ
ncbi:PepSY-associated TM helix domain-containing protein [Emticicia soli]|uniref:PepSY-associated TM helix domain-containing protein n=1 Tax=Emticicia soli TaxID=2027878 RepID=A0ABW5JDR8_9BACT